VKKQLPNGTGEPMSNKSRSSEIWREVRDLERARRIKTKELTEEYERTVYRPARLALQKECKEIGHVFGTLHDNGLGWTWSYCNICGDRFDVRGPDGELKKEDDDNNEGQ
jgi:hypothetical protein